MATLDIVRKHLGKRVEVPGKGGGTLRFAGSVHFSSGIFAGVELDAANGLNDGSVKGKTYFKCRPGHGTLLPGKKIFACSA